MSLFLSQHDSFSAEQLEQLKFYGKTSNDRDEIIKALNALLSLKMESHTPSQGKGTGQSSHIKLQHPPITASLGKRSRIEAEGASRRESQNPLQALQLHITPTSLLSPSEEKSFQDGKRKLQGRAKT